MPHVFHLIPHTHWDREWYLTGAAFLGRLVSTIDDLLTRLEAEPGFRSFVLDGQTVLLEDYLRVRPDEAPRVRTLVGAGRLQVGPWYVLADEQIPSGESLIRNLLLGASDTARLGGRMDVLYSPDAFGHPAGLPALAAEFGMRWGVLWRGIGGEPGQDFDLYRWRSPGGAAGDLLVYHLPPDGYEIGATLPADPARLGAAWDQVRAALVPRAATRHVAVFVGADHHAAHPDVAELCRLLATMAPGDEFRVSRLDEFFRSVEADAPTLPTLEGELRWSYRYTWTLQGVHGTRAPLKRLHAECELALARIAEPLAALAMRHDRRDRRPLLHHAWRTLVRSQFHDSIGGCTADSVARQVERRLDSARDLACEIARESLNALLDNDPDAAREHPGETQSAMALWNPAPRPRAGVVVADVTMFRRDVLVGPPGGRIPRRGPGAGRFTLQGPHGDIPVQWLGRRIGEERLDALRHYPDQDEVDVVRVAFAAPSVEGFGLTTLRLEPGRSPAPRGSAWARGRRLGTELVEVTIERDGSLQLLDRRTGQRFAGLGRLEAGGDVGDTYSYCPPAGDRIVRSAGPVAVRRLAAGPLVGAVEARWSFADVAVRLVVSVHAGSPAVRCTFELDNAGTDFRLRLRAPTGLSGGAAVAGTQFGAVPRGPVQVDAADYLRETPVPTAPAHRFVARADGTRGLAVLAPGFFEYELAQDGSLLVTLLRAVGALSRDDLLTRPGHAGWPVPTPLAQCSGHDRLQLAFCTVTDTEVAQISTLSTLWEDLFLPLQATWLRQASPLSPALSGLRLEGDPLVFSGLKPGEDGESMVLRCYNPSAEPVAGAWRFGRPVSTAHRVLTDERSLHSLEVAEAGHLVRFTADPLAIVTVAVC
jgi:mannosylglycerate hydrolase